MPAKKSTTRKAAAKSSARARTDVRDKPKDIPCCCGPKVLLSGGTSVTGFALSNKEEEDEHLQVRADANATVARNTSADGSGGSQLSTRLRKDIDAVVLLKTFRFKWNVDSRCQPLEVTVDVHGDVSAHIDCAEQSDVIELSLKSFLGHDQINADVSTATITVTATETCTNLYDTCSLTLEV